MLWAGLPWPALWERSLAPYSNSSDVNSLWTRGRQRGLLSPPGWSLRASIGYAGLVFLLLAGAACAPVSGSMSIDSFCQIYHPLPDDALGDAGLSESTIAVLMDNEIAYEELCIAGE